MPSVLVPMAEGFEEIEAITIIDLLRRAGIEVRTAGLTAAQVTGSHGITVQVDTTLDQLDGADFDMIVLPGGMPGAAHLRDDARVLALLTRAQERNRYVAAICAAPSVLAHAGLLDGRSATSFPGFLDDRAAPGLRLRTDPVVVDGCIVTSRGPGTAIDFALVLIELLSGRAVREQVEGRLQRPAPGATPYGFAPGQPTR